MGNHHRYPAADRRVFDGVADQIVDRLADPVGVAHGDEIRRRRHRDGLLLVGRQRLVGVDDLADQARDIDRLAADGDVEGVRHCVRNQMVDHRGQPFGGVADVFDLGGDAFLGRAGADQFGQHFGAAEDHAERVLQIVGDGAENFVLEAVGALQPHPLRRQPAVGLHQRAGALGDAIFELGVGLIQLLIKNDIVESDRQPAGKNLDQRAVGLRKRAFGLQQHHHFATAAGAQVKHAAVVGELVLAALERHFDHLAQVRIERFRSGRADEPAVAAGARQHREIGAVGTAIVAQYQNAGAIDIEQRGELRQHALGKALHRLEIVQSGGGIDDDFQPAPCLHHALELLIAAQCRGQ